MIIARSDELLCNGDSGSAAIDLSAPSRRVIRGTVQYGDAQCRATNTWNRIDTKVWSDFINSVRDDINAAAAAPV